MGSKEFDKEDFSLRAANRLMEVGVDTPDALRAMSAEEIEKKLNEIPKAGLTQHHVRKQLKKLGFIE
jgi:hypothetical protein